MVSDLKISYAATSNLAPSVRPHTVSNLRNVVSEVCVRDVCVRSLSEFIVLFEELRCRRGNAL